MDVLPNRMLDSLEDILRGRYITEERFLLEATVSRDGRELVRHLALNDVVVSKSAIARLNNFDLFIDKSFVSNYKADGLIVSPDPDTAGQKHGNGKKQELSDHERDRKTDEPMVRRSLFKSEVADLVRNGREGMIAFDHRRINSFLDFL